MFGYLPAPCRCQIGDRIDLYRSTFCGLCNALAEQYGQPARFLTNRDSAFVALLAAAQASEPPAATLSTRCQPWRRPLPVFESGPIPSYAAAVTLCGFQAKLVDERADERGLRAVGSRLLAALSRPRFDRAQAILVASGFPVNDARHRLDQQASIEARVASGLAPAEAVEATGRAFGAILAHTARLAGKNGNAAPLYRVGYSLGALVYTLDAYQDFQEDRSRGHFNYLAALTGPSQGDNLRQVRRLAREIAFGRLRQIWQAWQGVELLHYRSVLEAVLLTGLSARTERVLAPGSGRSLTDGYEEQKDEEEGNSTSQSSDCCAGGVPASAPVATTVAVVTVAIARTAAAREPTAAAATAAGAIAAGATAATAIAATVIAVAATATAEAGHRQSLARGHRAGVNFDLR